MPESRGILDVIDPGQAMEYANSLMSSLGGVFGNTFLILFTVKFASLTSDETRWLGILLGPGSESKEE